MADEFRDCFELECRALKKARNEMGLTNLEIMIPFLRTLTEAKRVVELLAENGLKRGENGLRLIMMCEIPSNALLAEQFLEYFDGFSIGSNDLTQLTLGLDRDSGLVAEAFDERDPAVKMLLRMAIQACRKTGKYVGICGQGPSDHPDLARWLMEEGIESLSLNPDTVVDTWLYLAEEAKNSYSQRACRVRQVHDLSVICGLEALIVIDPTHRYENINAGVCIYPLCKHLGLSSPLRPRPRYGQLPVLGFFLFHDMTFH